ncbi:hypothetical protein DIPPA_20157 [Diplonema papillatum]|nr:hypothetical protein DIPPA_20157 [Diplonema papillatum]
MNTVEHYNRKWFILMWTPENIFFAQINAANEKTLITVVTLVIACTVVAAVLGFLATLPLMTLARAFDKVAGMELDHADVQAVRSDHFVSELDSLHKGFWLAVKMVKQVMAFLPDMAETSDNITDDTGDGHESSSPRSRGDLSPVVQARRARVEVLEAFALGIKVSRTATLLVASFSGFSSICLADASEALSQHSALFQHFSYNARIHLGVISGLEASAGGENLPKEIKCLRVG